MENLNSIEIRGVVGIIKHIELAGTLHTKMSVATNYAYRDTDGTPIIETTWHNVSAFPRKCCTEETLRGLKKGDNVYIKGRVRNEKFIATDGTERTSVVIIPQCVVKVDEILELEFQNKEE